MSWKCIIKTGGAPVALADLGITIPATTTFDAHVDSTPAFRHEELAKSENLKAAVSAATVTINDGTDDLSIAQALRHLELNNGITTDMVDAIINSSSPDATNPFVTTSDLTAIGQDTLDSAYDGELGSGDGRIITADSGPVRIEGLTADYAGLSLETRTTKATTLAEGDIEMMKDAAGNIIPAAYDGTRTKLLSIDQDVHVFTDEKNTKNRYMLLGTIRSNENGSPIIANSTIVRAIVSAPSGPVTASVILRKRSDLGTDIATITITAASQVTENDLDIDLAAGDELVAYWSQGTGSTNNPVVRIYTKQRF